jgi:hypothetical protein
MFSGSVTENRITVGLPGAVRQVLTEEARRLGLKATELMRHVLTARALEIERDQALRAAPPTRADAIARYVKAGKPVPATSPVGPVTEMIAKRDEVGQV